MSLKELSLRTAQIETYLDLMLKRDLWARKFAFSFCVHIIGKRKHNNLFNGDADTD